MLQKKEYLRKARWESNLKGERKKRAEDMTRTIACERTELLMSIIGGISSVFRDHFSILLNLLILPFVVMRAPQPILIILHSPSLTFSLNPSLLLNIFVLIPVFSSATNAGGEIESSIVLNKGF